MTLSFEVDGQKRYGLTLAYNGRIISSTLDASRAAPVSDEEKLICQYYYGRENSKHKAPSLTFTE